MNPRLEQVRHREYPVGPGDGLERAGTAITRVEHHGLRPVREAEHGHPTAVIPFVDQRPAVGGEVEDAAGTGARDRAHEPAVPAEAGRTRPASETPINARLWRAPS